MGLELARQTLKKVFGYDDFRPLQAEIIHTVLQGKDAVVIMPTGGGKSICFQIPAIMLTGTAVVVSPLIALMKDQVEGLKAAGVRAAFSNSSISTSEQRVVEEEFLKQRLDLLYVSPEKLCTPDFQQLLSRVKVNLFAIDEAHCISSWGHQFRPEYRQLSFLKVQYPATPLLALTATADKVTRKDIAAQLGMGDPPVFLASFDRPNLSLEVRPGRKRWQQILSFVQQREGQSGIIYCGSRKSTEDIAQKLQDANISASFYHAGMTDVDRNRVQEAFSNDQVPIICATIAFGMGIDKSNIRWVIHYNLPKNIEGFYQEIGRAGRDGANADTLLFYSVADVMFQKRFINEVEGDFKNILLAKLKRLEEYASSPICRRKILLSYFGEFLESDCGNCDVCRLPPKRMDGTVLAQKALSAVYRMRGQANLNLLIDVLRGSRRREIFEKGFDQIKTYGAGAAYSYEDWRTYIEQLIQQGFLEIAIDDHYFIKLTEASPSVLFENRKIELVQPSSIVEREEAAAKVIRERKESPALVSWDDDLFQLLRRVRRDLATQFGVPPYIVFADKTLQEMAAFRPVDRHHLDVISGVGEIKKDRYGQAFLDAIREFGLAKGISEEQLFKPPLQWTLKEPPEPKKPSSEISSDMFEQGMDVEEIAKARSISTRTVLQHLVEQFEMGKPLDMYKLIDEYSVNLVRSTLVSLPRPLRLKPIFEALGGEVTYEEIRLALSIIQSEEG